jgi:hypothetical protein
MCTKCLKLLLLSAALVLCFVLLPEARGQSLMNVAAAANGGVASGSTIYPGYPPSAVINGDRTGGFAPGTSTPNFWNDNTLATYPDRIRVDFNGHRYISEIKVVTVQDNYQLGTEPTPGQTFTKYGIVDFEVQYLNENDVFVTVPGGLVTGNNLVIRQFQFTAVRAKAVRIVITKGGPAAPEYSRVVEIEVTGQALGFNLGAKQDNFRLHGSGYSVSKTLSPDVYHVFATGGYEGTRGIDDNADGVFDRYTSIYGQTSLGGGSGACLYTKSPTLWDPRCSSDSVGYLWKQVACPGGNVACQNNDRWNAWPGAYNVTTFPSPAVWPRTGTAWGTPGFQAILNHKKINDANIQPADNACATGTPTCPPKTGIAAQCHPYNPDDFATGAANSKAVQVKYADGSVRWFMAFNSMIKNSAQTPYTGADIWRVLWATSPDGGNWTVHPNILFRTIGETQECWKGFMMTDMFIDNGYFYVLLNDLGSSKTYMFRSQINTANPTANPGYTTWSVATLPANATQYSWVQVNLGAVLNLSQTAASIFPSRAPSQVAIVKQASVGRVFSNTNSAVSRYVGITNDKNSMGGDVVQLWSTADITKPFVFERELSFSQVPMGANGWEFGFTHYADNVPQTPRMLGNGFDFWIVENYSPWWSGPPAPLNAFDPNIVTVTRRSATLSGL